MKSFLVCVLLILAGAFYLHRELREPSLSIWGDGGSYTPASGCEFNAGAVLHDHIPVLVVFCKIQDGNKPVPHFIYTMASTGGAAAKVMIDGRPVAVPRDGFRFFVNDAAGKPRELKIDREVGEKILHTNHEGFVAFWNGVVAPQLAK